MEFVAIMKKKSIRNSSFFFILCVVAIVISSCSSSVSTPHQKNAGQNQLIIIFNLSEITIGLDPGHGWQGASGAVSEGIQEKDVNLLIAIQTKKVLENYGFKVVLTRTGDDNHSL